VLPHIFNPFLLRRVRLLVFGRDLPPLHRPDSSRGYAHSGRTLAPEAQKYQGAPRLLSGLRSATRTRRRYRQSAGHGGSAYQAHLTPIHDSAFLSTASRSLDAPRCPKACARVKWAQWSNDSGFLSHASAVSTSLHCKGSGSTVNLLRRPTIPEVSVLVTIVSSRKQPAREP
jgi:hypothetical protein